MVALLEIENETETEHAIEFKTSIQTKISGGFLHVY